MNINQFAEEACIRDFKPFYGNQEDWQKVYAALDSLYAMLDHLKEQKGVAKCRNCGVLLHEQCEYCPYCGKKVKWDD